MNLRLNQGSSLLSSPEMWLKGAKVPAFRVSSPIATLSGERNLRKPTRTNDNDKEEETVSLVMANNVEKETNLESGLESKRKKRKKYEYETKKYGKAWRRRMRRRLVREEEES